MANAYTKPIIHDIPDADCGPAMIQLTQKQRKFVLAWRDLGGGRSKAGEAVRAAGYSCETPNSMAVAAYRLTHDPKIIAALDEEAHGTLKTASIMVTQSLVRFAEEAVDEKVKLKALLALADRVGFHVVQEHKVTTQDISKTDDAVIARLKQLIAKNPANLHLVPKELLPLLEDKSGTVAELVQEPIDAEFEEVPADPDADLLGE